MGRSSEQPSIDSREKKRGFLKSLNNQILGKTLEEDINRQESERRETKDERRGRDKIDEMAGRQGNGNGVHGMG